MTRAPLAATLFAAALAFVVPAQGAERAHIRGTVAAVDGPAVKITTTDGKTVALTLGDGWKLGGLAPATLADVKQGTFVGTANVETADGNKALEVVVFPEAMRGVGEGNYGWDLKPRSAMTNANVKSLVEGVDGRTVTLSYKGGEKKVTIAPGTPIVAAVPATKADVVPGAKVFVVGTPSADGMTLSDGFIAVGKDGVTPPM